jgi:pimeloyl-ACP methyl ester carboxylesterase
VGAEEENMKRAMFSLGRVALVLLILLALATCVPPGGQSGTAPEGALSVDDLLANLDALQGSAARNLTPAGRSVFTTQAGKQISITDLAAYLNTIKQGFASAVRAHGTPYLVLPVPIASYPSKAADGITDVSLSGLMWVPFTWGRHLDAPIISLQHGTQVYRPSAPSRFNVNPLAVFSSPDQSGAIQNYVECIVGGLMASAGYIVVMPDYPGFGSSFDPHPFVQRSLGNSVRDLVAAAKIKLSGPVVPSNKVFLTGYSEGGYATIVGAQALQDAASAANSPLSWASIRAVVPCDGPYDLTGAMLAQMTGAAVKVPFYLLYTVFGYQSAYPSVIGTDYKVGGVSLLTDTAFKLLTVQTIFDGKHTNAQMPTNLGPSEMLNVPYANALVAPPSPWVPGPFGGPVYNLLWANNGYISANPYLVWVPSAPVYLVHCPDDDVIPIQNAENALAALSTTGASVSIVRVPSVPFIDTLLGSVHAAAYPTAMLAAFAKIELVNSRP